ncbi:hypothetical protein L6452_26072 [Arctium lappa]|uniref:Uncharacterized protein n=1 Tax=Arctium lappa TaxID=4217 RepID=A0ACB9ABX0_ARCLA|nr:hypothetical protein L6452_26072 [Arctium lappa]
MANEVHNSNPPTLLLGAPHDITNQNPTASRSVFTGSWGTSSSSSAVGDGGGGGGSDRRRTIVVVVDRLSEI